MDTNKMREPALEQFETAFRAQFGFGKAEIAESKDPEAAAFMGIALWAWEASRAAVLVDLPCLTDELLTAAYWDFDARRKGYPPYAAPAGQECAAFKVAVFSAAEASGVKVAP